MEYLASIKTEGMLREICAVESSREKALEWIISTQARLTEQGIRYRSPSVRPYSGRKSDIRSDWSK